MTDVELPPVDPDALDAWLEDRTQHLATIIDAAMHSIIDAAIASFDPHALVAAPGDLASFDAMRGQWQTLIDDELIPVLGQVYTGAGLSAILTSHVPDAGATVLADVVNESAVAYTRTATNRIVGAGDNLWRTVRGQLTDAVNSGTSTEDLKATIQKVTGYSEFRSDTIARTETMMAYNHGDNDSARHLGEYGPSEKQWLATMDNRTRESHADADGQTVPFDQDFIVGGASMPYPGEGPAAETINCRCTTLFLYPGDTRADGTIVGDDPLDMPAAVTGDEEIGNWIRGRLDTDPNASAAQLIREWKAAGNKVNDKRFRDIMADVKQGGSGVRSIEAAGSKTERVVAQMTEGERNGYRLVDRNIISDRIPTGPTGSTVYESMVHETTQPGRFTFIDRIEGGRAKLADTNRVAFEHRGLTISGRPPDVWKQYVREGRYGSYNEALNALRVNSRTWDSRLYQVERAMDSMPEELHAAVRQINFSEFANPADKYWAERYGIADFRSAATGGHRTITVYGDGAVAGPGTIRHEFGHNLETLADDYIGRAGRVSSSQVWAQAMADDARLNAERGIDRLLVPDNTHQLTPSNVRGISTYGQVSTAEDWAEATRLMFTENEYGSLGGRSFADLFPNRARVLSNEFDNAADQLRLLARSEGRAVIEAQVQDVVVTPPRLFDDAVGGRGTLVNGEIVNQGGTVVQSNAADPARWARIRDRYVAADDKTLLYNQRIRDGGPLTGGAANHLRDMRWLTSQGSFGSDATVYRGAILDSEQTAALQPGFTLTDKAPMSTGLDQATAEFYARERAIDGAVGDTVIFKIQVHAGQAAADVGGEIVLAPGSSLQVVSVTRRADGVLEVLASLA